MAIRGDTTCSACYFRREGLCALATETPCPTFRQSSRGRLTPPRQAQLVPLTGKARVARVTDRDTGREAAPFERAPERRPQQQPVYA